MRYGPLIDVATLASLISRPDPPTVLDARWNLGGPPGRHEYDRGHLPDAIFLDLDDDLSGPPGPGGRHPLPDPDVLQAVLRAAGVRAGHPVAVYDGGGWVSAARAWWTLRWVGHEQVAVLDGGYPAWVAANQPVTRDAPRAEPGDLIVKPGGLPVLDAPGAAELAAGGVLLDVRAAPRYRGETEPIDPVAGHIPGAVNLPATEQVGPDGRLLAADTLRSRFAEVGVAAGVPVGAYCGSGVTAAQTVFALHVAGRTDARLYVGSWSEWITDPSRPIATGAQP